MHKLMLIFLLIFSLQTSFAQDSLRTMKSTSNFVSLNIGDDLYLKNGWILEPSKKPDVYVIRSKWFYKSKKVTFSSDIDSLSFNVVAGHSYNFIILLHGVTKCYIQIVTLPDPLIWNFKILASIVLVFFLSLFFIYKNNRNFIAFLLCGYASPIFFWLITFISGAIHGDYNHLKNVVSELGAIGTKSEFFTSVCLILLSLLCLLFSIEFYKLSRRFKLSVIPALSTFFMPFTFLWAAIFPLGNELHTATGPLPLFVALGNLLSYILWKKDNEFSTIKNLILVSFFFMMLLLTRFIKPFGEQFEGLTQRFFYLGWSIWTITITYYFNAKIKKQKDIIN
jgi:hypothetical membrane protein